MSGGTPESTPSMKQGVVSKSFATQTGYQPTARALNG